MLADKRARRGRMAPGTIPKSEAEVAPSTNSIASEQRALFIPEPLPSKAELPTKNAVLFAYMIDPSEKSALYTDLYKEMPKPAFSADRGHRRINNLQWFNRPRETESPRTSTAEATIWLIPAAMDTPRCISSRQTHLKTRPPALARNGQQAAG